MFQRLAALSHTQPKKSHKIHAGEISLRKFSARDEMETPLDLPLMRSLSLPSAGQALTIFQSERTVGAGRAKTSWPLLQTGIPYSSAGCRRASL